jgi:hypothetical protein
MTCPLCGSPATFRQSLPVVYAICPVCGSFNIGQRAIALLGARQEFRFPVACWTYHQSRREGEATIEFEQIEAIAQLPPPSVEARAEAYLGAVIDSFGGRLSGRFNAATTLLCVASCSAQPSDAHALAEYLEHLGAIRLDSSIHPPMWQLLAKGHIIHEQMTGRRRGAVQAFVAMWFAPELKPAYEQGFAVAISGAGYSPLRVDMAEHAGKIDDRIIAEIRRSAFIVADFTGHRGGVYYEAGFAHGLNRPAFFACRDDHKNKLHFDVRQYNTILWKEPTDIIRSLQNRILAVLGAGSLNPEAGPIP